MAVRFIFVFLIAVVIFQNFGWKSHAIVIRRDVSSNNKKSAAQTIDDALESLKNSFDDIVKNMQDNELMQNISQAVKTFGERVQQQGQQLVTKIQDAAQKN